MAKNDVNAAIVSLKELLSGDDDFVREAVRGYLQDVLEEEMTAAVGAGKGERSLSRLGYRSGYYERALVTRVGRIELRVPQDRDGRFSTDLFERYQRSEKALVSALTDTCRVYPPARSRRSPRSCAGTGSRLRRSPASSRNWTGSCGPLPGAGWTSLFPI